MADENWGSSLISYGVTLLVWEWIYVPLSRGLGVEPWTMTQAGLATLAMGIVLFTIHEYRKQRR